MQFVNLRNLQNALRGLKLQLEILQIAQIGNSHATGILHRSEIFANVVIIDCFAAFDKNSLKYFTKNFAALSFLSMWPSNLTSTVTSIYFSTLLTFSTSNIY